MIGNILINIPIDRRGYVNLLMGLPSVDRMTALVLEPVEVLALPPYIHHDRTTLSFEPCKSRAPQPVSMTIGRRQKNEEGRETKKQKENGSCLCIYSFLQQYNYII